MPFSRKSPNGFREPNDPLSREERLVRVRGYLAELQLRHYQAWVFGSVGRGDFTKESDTDVLVVSDELPVDRKRRLDRIFDARTVAPEMEPVGWLEDEWREREINRDSFLDAISAVTQPGLPGTCPCPRIPTSQSK